ncbi:VOC family protein [Deinococcus sp. Leaf326]|uniref:VOC family protein n=1 Tax=Deinococcus sp. Leaf326 TaxID=1736338 RepID=UPI0006FD2474|nr:VOC family protein [Deinococcus sp. Leaf326]KQR04491.1 glyoxalase [Deinococcus sp. Leaf326]
MNAHLDHLVIAARTLAEGRAWLEGRLGTALAPGGEHETFGTHNALLSLGGTSYLEVIAVNPDAPAPPRARWFSLDTPEMRARLDGGPALVHWVARVLTLEAGPYPEGEVLELSRGENRWALTVPPDGSLPLGRMVPSLGGVAPSLIAWHTPAPPTRLPASGVTLATLRLGTPQPAELRAVLDRLGFVGEVEVYEAPQPELGAQLDTPGGVVLL